MTDILMWSSLIETCRMFLDRLLQMPALIDQSLVQTFSVQTIRASLANGLWHAIRRPQFFDA
jgi:hypothetical protein